MDTFNLLLGAIVVFLPIILLSILALGLLSLKLYGIYLSFKKRWYYGIASIFVPFLADAVSVTKLVFKKDLYKLLKLK